MATRSLIGLQNKNKTITYIYCHWDGYPSHNGKLLVEHYNDIDKIKELLSLGDLSCLGEQPISTPNDWEERDKKHCVAYKDRGETGVDAKISSSLTEFLFNEPDIYDAEYTYVFIDGKWKYFDGLLWNYGGTKTKDDYNESALKSLIFTENE